MGGTILLADDSLTIQKVVELTFAETAHRVVAVGGGRELLARLAEVKPDVILCDVVMPDMTGYEVCQSLKSDPARLHIPVVLLTGTFEPFDRDRALASGCDAIITKPFEARELIDTVEQLIARSRSVATEVGPPELEGLGVPEGVAALDFTTTGFEKMVPPPEAPLLPPEEGIELTASVAEAAPPAPMPPADAPVAPAPEEETAPPFALAVASTPPGEVAPWGEAERAAPAEFPAPAAASPAAPEAEVAAAPPPVAAGGELSAHREVAVPVGEVQLSDEQIERIARRVVELAAPQLERIAWEVIPDMAEMIVRQRIRELEAAAEAEN